MFRLSLTVLDLVALDPAMVRRRWSVTLELTVRELQGLSCIELEHSPQAKQEIARARSFGHPVTALSSLNEAVTEFASRAAIKLRKQGSLVALVMVFIRTSPFRQDPQYSLSINVSLRPPTADTAFIVDAAMAGLQTIYRPGFNYAKAGVMLLDLQSDQVQQEELKWKVDGDKDRGSLMSSLDDLNQRFGPGTVQLASAGLHGDRRVWAMKEERRTPAYTTRLADMPTAKA